MYAPLGLMLILQPDEMQSPAHPLLPPGASLYQVSHPDDPLATLSCHASHTSEGSCSPAAARLLAKRRAEVRAAVLAFLNNPHPLETLADPASYGQEGSISRDHDPRSYTAAAVHVTALQIKKKVHQQQIQRLVQLQQELVLFGLHLQMQGEGNTHLQEAEATWYLVHGQFEWLSRLQASVLGSSGQQSTASSAGGDHNSEMHQSLLSYDKWQSSFVSQCRDEWDDAAMACNLPTPSPSSISWRANDPILYPTAHPTTSLLPAAALSGGDGRAVSAAASGGGWWSSLFVPLSFTQKAGAAVALAAALYQILPSYTAR